MKDNAALYASVRDLKKQVAKIDASALARLAKKVAAQQVAIQRLQNKEKDADTATELWRKGTSDMLGELLAAVFRIEMRTAHPDARPTPTHPDEKPTPKER